MRTWQKIKSDSVLLEKCMTRELVVDVIRSFFKKNGFSEVFTPIMVSVPSIESNLEVFETQLRTNKGNVRKAYLTMSPEYSIKKLLSSGIGNAFEITKSFRNEEEVSSSHNPEFMMLEWYRVNADYTDVMRDFENLFVEIIKTKNPSVDLTTWEYQGKKYDLSLPWPKWSISESFLKYSNIDTDTLIDENKLLNAAKEKGYKIEKDTTWEQVFYQIMFNEIEPEMGKSGRPVFLYDYPASQAALSKKKVDDPRFAERFEVFLAGMEMGNCFSELTDPTEQRMRFEEDYKTRKMLQKTDYPIDEDLLKALESGMPQVSGIAVGVDRLVMLAANANNISETLFFPACELFEIWNI